MKTIKLTNSRKTVLVDDDDAPWLEEIRWRLLGGKKNYAVCNIVFGSKRYIVYMHRVIMAAKKGVQVDHKSRNTLDNRKSELRLCSHSQNKMNQTVFKKLNKTSKFKGVFWCNTHQRWIARIRVNGKHFSKHLKNELEAAKMYNEFAKKHHGDFACLNPV